MQQLSAVLGPLALLAAVLMIVIVAALSPKPPPVEDAADEDTPRDDAEPSARRKTGLRSR